MGEGDLASKRDGSCRRSAGRARETACGAQDLTGDNTDLFVVVPEQDVIFVGDALESDGDPCFSTASSFVNWPKALDGVLGASAETTRFIPGHGPVLDMGGETCATGHFQRVAE